MNVELHFSNNKKINSLINLVSSKSESNRALIIQALCNNKFEISNLSTAEDTVLLQKLLQINTGKLNCNHGGTTLRFLTAFFSCTKSDVILTGSTRLKERPISILVNALRKIGASITHLEQDGSLPIHIKGKNLKGGKLSIDASVSSQFISALLLIAPILKHGLEINFSNSVVSKSYINLTIEILNYFGIEILTSERKIFIRHQHFKAKDILIENDWSAASYWYCIAALHKNCNIQLPSLKKNSMQGDSVLVNIFKQFGVNTIYTKKGVTLRYNKNCVLPEIFQYDFTNCPDLAQTIAVTCAALGIESQLTGLETLTFKESNRIEAVCKELEKFGAEVLFTKNSIQICKGCNPQAKNIFVNTYNDHRMAMAFAPLTILYETLKIEDFSVVKKSYPNFWNDLKQFGFEISLV